MEPTPVNRHPPSRRPRWGALVAFATAFAVVEAVLVLELRLWLDPDGEVFPLVSVPEVLLRLEGVREVATLVVLAAAAAAAGGVTARGVATFFFLFGVWDLGYYAVLRLLGGWPGSLADWDLLFLFPVAWIAPVYAPLLVSVVMIAVGVATLQRRRAPVVRARHVAAALAGGGLCIWSFTFDAEARALTALPTRYPVELLIAGLGVAGLGYVDTLRGARRSSGR